MKPADLLIIKPGGTVSLNVQLGQYQQHRQAVVDGLTKKLEANGMQVVDDSNVRLIVTAKPGEIKQVTYRTFGRGMATQQHAVPTQLTSLSYQVDDKAVWTSGGEILPSIVRSSPNESIDAAISRQINDIVAGLGNSRIPKYVAKLPDGKVVGTSRTP